MEKGTLKDHLVKKNKTTTYEEAKHFIKELTSCVKVNII